MRVKARTSFLLRANIQSKRPWFFALHLLRGNHSSAGNEFVRFTHLKDVLVNCSIHLVCSEERAFLLLLPFQSKTAANNLHPRRPWSINNQLFFTSKNVNIGTDFAVSPLNNWSLSTICLPFSISCFSCLSIKTGNCSHYTAHNSKSLGSHSTFTIHSIQGPNTSST